MADPLQSPRKQSDAAVTPLGEPASQGVLLQFYRLSVEVIDDAYKLWA
jgi:hypothetical protein